MNTQIQRIAPEIVEKIRDAFDTFTKSQRVIGEYIIQHPEHVGALPISELAGRVGVSEPTVVRFCRALGYAGYAEFGKEVQAAISYELSTIGRFRIASDAKGRPEAGGESAFERIVSQELGNIRQLSSSVAKTDFYKLVDWMQAADHLVIGGFMASEALAEYFHYAAAKLLPSVKLLTSLNAEASNFLRPITEDSLLIMLAFPRYPRAALQMGRIVKETGCKVVAITDSHRSPLVEIADLVLMAPITLTTVVDAYSAPMTLIMALVCELSERDPAHTERSLDYFERYANELGMWTKPLTRNPGTSENHSGDDRMDNGKNA